jgi:hypothetical protein
MFAGPHYISGKAIAATAPLDLGRGLWFRFP